MLFYVLLTVLSISARASLASVETTAPHLTDAERSSLRLKLENLYNEVDLAVRDRRADEDDLKRQIQTADVLRIYDRIPFQPRLGEILPQLTQSARNAKVELKEFKWLDPKARQVATHSHNSSDSVVEVLPFRFIASGTEAHVRTWILGWTDSVVRLVEPKGGLASPKIQGVGENLWLVEAHAFRFKPYHPTHVSVADPMTLLPEWAQKNPQQFAADEPVLWDLVQKTEKTTPTAAPLLVDHEKYRATAARLHFFFSKANTSAN
jgi:hypothetical protein